jgi:hypothetical protein
MKHVAQNYKYGDLGVVNAPVLVCKPEGVLVRSLYSLISTRRNGLFLEASHDRLELS